MTIAAVTRKQRPRHQASRRVNLFGWWPWALLGLLSYPQLFASKPGWLAADTKVYLYLDPTKILSSAQSLWNPDLGLGTVTHQNIGYLFPMGPYYWLVHALGIPMWVGQRFWIGSLFFLAGAGILFVGRLLGLGTMGRTTAAIVYMLSPYVIDYIARSSAIVMPWAGLGWMLGFAILAARRGGWRYPALFALVVATVGGVNATSILFVGIAPVLWLFYAAGLREIAWKDVWRVAWRVALLCFFVSLWWASGLWAEGAYGINILLFTESIPTVVATSLSSEVLRGLGYWYFYGADNLEHWTLAAPAYMREAWVLGISFSVPVVAMASGFLARWRYRGYAVLLIVISVVFSVSAYPITSPTPFGHLLKTAGEQSTAGLAMRSSSRIVPIVVLGLALLLGAGVTALGRWRWWAALVVGAGASVAAILNLAPLFTGHLIAENLKFPNTLPSYTTDAAHFLNSHDTKTRVLGIPGEDFAYYRWGSTMDPIWPGLLDRPYVGRQAVAMGEPSSVNLVRALDESIQDGTFDPKSVAPMARLMSAGDVLLQSDLQNERYGLPRPQAFWLKMDPPPPGLGTPVTFGPPVSTRTQVGTIIDETQLGIPAGSPLAPSIAVFPVASPRPVVRTEPTKAPLIVAGDGEGLLEAGLFGYLDPKRSIFYSASFPSKAALEAVDSPGSTYLITDSNARRLDAWGILHTTFGYVMGTDESPIAYNPNEQAMQVFPEAPASTQTVSTLTGVKGVEATAYGNPVANVPENRPILAYDGDTRTAWEEGSFSNAIGARLQIRLDSPTTTDHVTLLQPVIGPRNRRVTKVTLAFDGARRVTAVLGKDSLHNPGQKITFPSRTFSTLSITIDGETGSSVNFLKYSGIGFAEVTIGDLPKATEALRLPTDLLDKAGTASDNHEVDLLMNRLRANGVPPRSDPEYAMNRVVNLPSARSFEVGGLARISDLIPDPLLNDLVGRTASTVMPPGSAAADRIVQTNSSGRLLGDLNAGSWSAEDGKLTTAWQTGFDHQAGAWIEIGLARPLTFGHLDLQIVADGRHQVPTGVTVIAGGVRRVVPLPEIPLGFGRPQGSTTLVPIDFPSVTGSLVRLRINDTAPIEIPDSISRGRHTPPLAIAELGLPGVAEPLTPESLPPVCRNGLIFANGDGTSVAIVGTTSDALALKSMAVTPCTTQGTGVILGEGRNDITTGDGSHLGWNIDQLKLTSAPSVASLGDSTAPSEVPTLRVTHSTRWAADATLVGSGSSAWLVLGQSHTVGWHALLGGRDLGPPVLIDGYANGWRIPAVARGETVSVRFVWAPQRVVNLAEIISAIALMVILTLVLWPRRRRSKVLGTGDVTAVPTLRSPLLYRGRSPGWICSIAISLLMAAGGALVAGRAGGLAAGITCFIGLRIRWSRLILILGSVGAMAAAGATTVVLEHQHHFPYNIGWPAHFNLANAFGWIAVVVLLADAVVEGARHRWPKRRRDDDEASNLSAEANAMSTITEGQET